MKQHGYFMVGMGIALAVLTVVCLGLWNRLGAAHEETAVVRGQFAAFKGGVEDAGKKAEAKKAEAIAEQKKEYNNAIEYWTGAYAALNLKYDGLLNRPRSDPGSRVLPPVPDTTRPVDDQARDQRLLQVLRAAEEQTIQLVGLQNWVAANKDSCGR